MRTASPKTGLHFLITLWLVVLRFSVEAAPSIPIQYSARLWQTEDGLPQNAVQAVLQTRDGYLWVGTQHGLARFDGVRFAVFNGNNVPEMRSSSISALCEGKDGSLWIATERGGLNQLKAGKFYHYGKKDGLASDEGLRGLFAGSDGSIWISTTNGLSQFKDGKFRTFSRENSLSSSVVRSVCEDVKGNIWVATAGGADWLKDGTVIHSLWTGDASKGGNKVTAICADSKSNLWVGVAGGLSRVADGKVTRYTETNGLSDKTVSALFEDRQGTIWIGTYGGLNRFVGEKIETEVSSDGQPFDLVNAICEDREGDIWIAAKEGLTRLKPKRFSSYTQRDGLLHNNVISVFEDREQTLLIGTWGGGLHEMKAGVITPVPTKGKVNRWPLSIDLVLALEEDQQGQLWIGTDFNGGLFRRGPNGKYNRYGLNQGLAEAAVRVVCEDSSARVWVGTSSGLFQVKDGRCHRNGGKQGLKGNLVRVIVEDKQRRLWVGTDDGLNRLDGDNFTTFTTKEGLSSSVIYAIYEDAEGTLWIGTRGGGLNRFKDGKFKAYTTREGLFNDDVFEILEDGFGYLWMTCRAGIFRVKKSDLAELDRGGIDALNCHAYGKPDGLASTECTAIAKPGAYRTRDGRLWFATSKGLVVTDPKTSMKANEFKPPVIIEKIFVDRKPVSKNENLRFPPGRGELEFHYTALSFQAPERNRFKYKLEGVDSDWIDAGTRRSAFYNNISPGSYRFRVIASNNDGAWNEKGDSVSLVMEPHLWQTRSFQALVGVLLFGVVAAIVRYISVRKLKSQVQILERQRDIEQERARIAQDMHDDLGARLTEIMLLSDVAERKTDGQLEAKAHVTRIARASREVVQSLDTIVWAVNPRNDSLNNLAVYIYEYLDRFMGASAVRCRLDVPDQLPDWPLSSEARHNLFLVVKETVNNVVKHANATEMWFRVRFDDSLLTILIEDNGQGFSVGDVSPTGNGLDNMRLRMEKVGGTFCVSSEPGRGTQTQICLPVSESETVKR